MASIDKGRELDQASEISSFKCQRKATTGLYESILLPVLERAFPNYFVRGRKVRKCKQGLVLSFVYGAIAKQPNLKLKNWP